MIKLETGDAKSRLRKLPPACVNMGLTSPPFWGLRDYGAESQLGMEASIEEYISNLCDVFEEVKRVLLPTGTCCIEIGDCYGGASPRRSSKPLRTDWGLFNPDRLDRYNRACRVRQSIRSKSLALVPERLAIALYDRGWIVRNILVWHKPNARPESAKDRFTVDHSTVLFLTKQQRYDFDQQFEPVAPSTPARRKRGVGKNHKNVNGAPGQTAHGLSKPRIYDPEREASQFRNMRSVWTIPTASYRGGHWSVFPEKLAERCIRAGCPAGGLVLDPFIGSGTTAVVAERLGRHCLGIDINPTHIELAKQRIRKARAIA